MLFIVVQEVFSRRHVFSVQRLSCCLAEHVIIIIIIHEFHGDTSLEAKLQSRSKCHVLG